jgi:hypothetical protein
MAANKRNRSGSFGKGGKIMVEFKEFLNIQEESALTKEFEVTEFLACLIGILVTVIIFMTSTLLGVVLGISLGIGLIAYLVLTSLANISIKQNFILKKLCEKKKWEFVPKGEN